MSVSCIYEGTIRHRRAQPRRELRHRLALVYLDLDELPRLLDGRLVRARPGVVRFRRGDYLGDPRIGLADAVRGTVEASTGVRPDGPVRVLTHVRSFGHCFNPVSFYYCMDGRALDNGGPNGSCMAGGTRERVQALLVEVTNTPWGERRSYATIVTDRPSRSEGGPAPALRATFVKTLHVSPFMGMDCEYELRATPPGETLSVHIESRPRRAERRSSDAQPAAAAPTFDATLALRRRELTRTSLAAVTARYPAATVRVLTLIYAHAFRLWLTGTPVHPHPSPPPQAPV